MRLEGSCDCGSITFVCESKYPLPYLRCYCATCRKTSGGGGYLIYIVADSDSLQVKGREHVGVYRAMKVRRKPVRSRHERHFCTRCGSHLWAFHPNWPDLLQPVASAIDTPLPDPPANVHMMVDSKAGWVVIEGKPNDVCFGEYPDKSPIEWHVARGLEYD